MKAFFSGFAGAMTGLVFIGVCMVAKEINDNVKLCRDHIVAMNGCYEGADVTCIDARCNKGAEE